MQHPSSDPPRREKRGVAFHPAVYAYLRHKADEMERDNGRRVSVSELINRVFLAEMGQPYVAANEESEEQ